MAEGVRALGGVAAGSLEEFRKLARLKESPSTVPLGSTHMIESLLPDHEALIAYPRSDLELSVDRFHDAGTNNFLTDLWERHEKTAWMLRAHLEERYR